ncbi:MAG TPA: hypothetical protein VKQ27_14555, partial [Acetobacteraceae bacterium]|nr:hypothetical protein [Acetobacteraceae bacterium]
MPRRLSRRAARCGRMVLAQRPWSAAGQGTVLAWAQRAAARYGARAAVAAAAEVVLPRVVAAAAHPGRVAVLQAVAARVRLSVAAFVVRLQVAAVQAVSR